MILELNNITLSFAGGRDSFKLLDDLNLCIRKGNITALVGGNGADKTTLFNIISGFQKDFRGNVIFKGENINKTSADRIARKGIGRLFQGKLLIQDLSLIENMLLASHDCTGEMPFSYIFRKNVIIRKEKEKKLQAAAVLNKLFGENNKYIRMLDHKGSDFSYGEQRLICLARLFMGNSSLLLLDEPIAGVNPVYVDTIKGIVKQLVKDSNTSVLLIEHNMPFVSDVAGYCAYMNEGKITCEGLTREVLENQEVKNSYLGL